tara:strand:+ start:125 stop:1102 length:978 start_codon:yes stop_codon:yes gene_type:complete
MKKKNNILVTGSAGFIGFHLSKKLLKNKINVVGLDNLNSYYDIKLKKDRNKILKKNKQYFFHKISIENKKSLEKIFSKYQFKSVIHLAAQAGVRNSIKDPDKYFKYNVLGFYNILELCRRFKIKHLLFASTSSVYGLNKFYPLNEDLKLDTPQSFYAASKHTNEIMAYSYSNIFNLKITGMRFFTVYGPYGRPDMALFKFVDNIFNKKPIELYNSGDHIRDFTYVDDVVESIIKLSLVKSTAEDKFDVFNIGSSNPIKLTEFLKYIEDKLGKNPKIKKLKFQKGDIHKTHADVKKLYKITNFKPKTNIKDGIEKFINWYKDYYSK